MEALGDNIYKQRIKKHLTQAQLAEKIGVSRQSVTKWEDGRSRPELEKLLRLCELFGCTLDELAGSVSRETDPQQSEKHPSDITVADKGDSSHPPFKTPPNSQQVIPAEARQECSVLSQYVNCTSPAMNPDNGCTSERIVLDQLPEMDPYFRRRLILLPTGWALPLLGLGISTGVGMAFGPGTSPIIATFSIATSTALILAAHYERNAFLRTHQHDFEKLAEKFQVTVIPSHVAIVFGPVALISSLFVPSLLGLCGAPDWTSPLSFWALSSVGVWLCVYAGVCTTIGTFQAPLKTQQTPDDSTHEKREGPNGEDT